jgi:hypothetical protein
MSGSHFKNGLGLNYDDAMTIVDLPHVESPWWNERGFSDGQVVKPDGLHSEAYPQISRLLPWYQTETEKEPSLRQMFERILNESSDKAILALVGPRRCYKSWLLVAMFIQDVWIYILTTDRVVPHPASGRDKVTCVFVSTHTKASENLQEKVQLCLNGLPERFTNRIDLKFVTENECRIHSTLHCEGNAVMVYLDEFAFLSPMFMRTVVEMYHDKGILSLRGSTTKILGS